MGTEGAAGDGAPHQRIHRRSVTIAAASIDTHVAKRDGDLRSARYLDVTTYPAITFASTRLTEYPGASGAWRATSRSRTSPARSSS
jgi:hypothetical protein